MTSLWSSLESRLFDTHCHPLDFPDPVSFMGECEKRHLRTHAMSVLPEQYLQLRKLSETSKFLFPSLGLFPLYLSHSKPDLAQFLDLLPDSLYVGEVGLDFTEGAPSHEFQVSVLDKILSTCDHLGGRVVSLHSRRAGQEVLDLCQKSHCGSMILHWFSGPISSFDSLPQNIYFSVNTAMLRSRQGRSLLAACPRSRVLLESDGPYVESGGKPVHPWELRSVVESLSKRWCLNLEGVLDQLNDNLNRVDDSVKNTALRAPFLP